LSIRVDGQTTLFGKYLTIFFEIAVDSARIFTEPQSGEENILPPQLRRIIIVLVYTQEVISTTFSDGNH